jgi:hypothetical protein
MRCARRHIPGRRVPAVWACAFAWLFACMLTPGAMAEPAGLADETGLPVEVQYPLILKILQFDRNLVSRAGTEIVIATIYQGRHRASVRARDEVHRAAKAASAQRVADLPVRVVDVDIEQVDLAQALESMGVDVAYVMPLRAVNISTITGVTREMRIATVTGVEEYVHDGVSVGLGVFQEKPRVLVNLDASRAEGVDFSSRLLSLAQLVK